jgi:cation diffusion facilitator family transporter
MYPLLFRLGPIGVLTCAALMGVASFEVMKESVESLFLHHNSFEEHHWSSVWNMLLIVVTKLGLLVLCQKAGEERTVVSTADSENNEKLTVTTNTVIVRDSTMEALALDHLNDCLSNVVAAIALTAVIFRPWLWWVDPVGAIVISAYIMYSWFSTGREQIEQLTGKAAPADFVEELREIASNYDPRVVVDVCRAYHFGPKFLVELEIVLPKDTLLFESHDIGMDLQYEIEAREEVERCFVHIDYEKREYDEHVVSKVPELLAFIRNSDQVDVRRSISM